MDFQLNLTSEKKENWLACAIASQKLYSSFFYYVNWAEVPRSRLKEKLDSLCYFFESPTKCDSYEKIESMYAIIKEKGSTITSESGFDQCYELRPVFIHFTSLAFNPKETFITVLVVFKNRDYGTTFCDGERIYSSWNDYLTCNTLPEGYMLFPENGTYYQSNEIHLTKSAFCSFTNQALRLAEDVSTGLGLGSSILLASGLVPKSWESTLTKVVEATGAFNTFNGVRKLHDLNSHGESLMSTSNPRALSAYSDILSGIGGACTAVAIGAGRDSLDHSRSMFYKSIAVLGAMAQVPKALELGFPAILNDGNISMHHFLKAFLNIFIETADDVSLLFNALEKVLKTGSLFNLQGAFKACKSSEDINREALTLCTSVSHSMRPMVEPLFPLISKSRKDVCVGASLAENMRKVFNNMLRNAEQYYQPRTISNSSTVALYRVYTKAFYVARLLRKKSSFCFKSLESTVKLILQWVEWFHEMGLKAKGYVRFRSSVIFLDKIANTDMEFTSLPESFSEFMHNRKLLEFVSEAKNELPPHYDASKDQAEDECMIDLTRFLVYSFPKLSGEANNSNFESEKSLKRFYRQKASFYVNETVSKKNSKFEFGITHSALTFETPDMRQKRNDFKTKTAHLKLSLEKTPWTLMSFYEIDMSADNNQGTKILVLVS